MQKQIERMTKALRQYECFGNCQACAKCWAYPMAEKLYEAGYRKQSEGEWNENIIGFCNVCMSCGAIVERSAIKNNSGKLNFCPNCGLKMKGGKG
jgi:hypothetical protein